VIVKEHLDKTIKLRLRDNYFNYKTLSERTKKEDSIKLVALTKHKQSSTYIQANKLSIENQFLFDKLKINQPNFAKLN